MHFFNRRPHDGSSSVIQIGDGLDLVEVEILEIVGEQVIVGVIAPRDTSVRRKEAVASRPPGGPDAPPRASSLQ